MIKLSDKFNTEWDGRQWVLYETYEGKDKKCQPKDQVRESYHGTLRQACNKVVDASARDCGDAMAISTMISNSGWVLEGKAAGYIK